MRKKPNTPRSRVKAALHKLFLYSREHQTALKEAQRKCARCGVKASAAKGQEQKVEVHHIDNVNWKEMLDIVFERILVNPKRLKVLCKECHKKEHLPESILP